jgi:hypothetical protein
LVPAWSLRDTLGQGFVELHEVGSLDESGRRKLALGHEDQSSINQPSR